MLGYRNPDAAGKGRDFPRSLPTMSPAALPFRHHGFTITKNLSHQDGPDLDHLIFTLPATDIMGRSSSDLHYSCVPRVGSKVKVKLLKFLSNTSLSAGTGSGEA
jgi:hypothetical protein